jgi:RNA polymerase sigma-70 factor (ECF subfamily)
MMWRIARLDLDGALTPETDGDFEQVLAGPAAAETSLLSRLKQHLCSDEDLADQLQSGNTEALAALFKRHSPLVFAISRRVLRNDSEAEDAVQQIFLDVFRSIHQFDAEKGSFKTWLLMFAYHRTFNCRRTQIANRFFETDPLEQDPYGAQRTACGQSAAENSVLVGQVLKSLQPRQRRTIELVYYEGLTAEEVSVKTGESVRVVRHNLYRGLDKLRKAFRAERRCSREKEVKK